MTPLNPKQNFEKSRSKIGYVPRKKATQKDYDRIGFMSGLEIHQQLLTDRKLFCRCPAGKFQKENQYDAEVIRHMRPTLSELGEYDGTALMEFKTRKKIIYRIANQTACTYEVDDTPPFPINRQALETAIEIALLSKFNIVGEVHITRKQYLDGSIPTGFQRTAIIGIEGSIQLKKRQIQLIQLSIEEDSCREVSDIGHTRIYRTDRLGMPLIETVTYPEMKNPDEVKECCDYIRFLNRSTGKVRTGIGAGREDVNISCTGGTRIEIKGVAHSKWIPELAHEECFRQWALLAIKDELLKRTTKAEWKINVIELDKSHFKFDFVNENDKVYAINLPHFEGLLSHFTQKNKAFYEEFTHRLKVIACIERPNMITSEDLDTTINPEIFDSIKKELHAGEDDAQIIFRAPKEDVKTAIDVIEERALMTFDGVPQETRKSLADGTTIFERVLPGADRMYPDTDSAPIPLTNEEIEIIKKRVPPTIHHYYEQLIQWEVPEDCFPYIFTYNYYPLILKISQDLHFSPKFIGIFFGQKLKHLHGICGYIPFGINRIYDLFAYLKNQNISMDIAEEWLSALFAKPELSINEIAEFYPKASESCETIKQKIKELDTLFQPQRRDTDFKDKINYIMGELRPLYLGGYPMKDLANLIQNNVK